MNMISTLRRRFTSGNSIPVTRVAITAGEFDQLQTEWIMRIAHRDVAEEMERLDAAHRDALEEVEQLKAQRDAALARAGRYDAVYRELWGESSDYAVLAAYEIVACESPAQSLAKIQAQAVEKFAGDFVHVVCSGDGVGFEGLEESMFSWFARDYAISIRDKARQPISNPAETSSQLVDGASDKQEQQP